MSASPAEAFRDRDCSDFKTQRQAQKFFKKHKGSKKRDPHRLDADHDGRACEDSY
ncbi:MAG TPA: excalibur calcium-binding domain-containing protein [Solirubrobacterales bacterium]|nr:excalibur calcium-binding domain-containing protein [Solirubrobacterales bacterium]